MCGRYTIATQLELIEQRFKVKGDPSQFAERFNVAPTQYAPVVVYTDKRELKPMRWGLVPSWAKDTSIGNRMINARGETLAEKPSFKRALEKRRCLVVADGFFEWQLQADHRSKQPVRFVLKNQEPFAFAGLWESWRGSEGDPLETYTIITTEANELVRDVHDRMPVMLKPQDEAAWLGEEQRKTEELIALLGPYPAELMEMYAVTKAVNSPRNDSPECIAPQA